MSSGPAGARALLAFAADLPLEQALHVYREVSPFVGCAKVGLSLFVEHGPKAVEAFRALGAEVFLDLKLHDIPNTVELAAERAGALGVRYLTVHASGGGAMLEAAQAGARRGAEKAKEAAPALLAVTVLTSLSESDVAQLGFADKPEALALRLARLAEAAGLNGLVCSAREAAGLRAALREGFVLCTPGIRPAGGDVGDQARVETPASAIRAGSSLLVVGRPIYAAPSPAEAAEAIAREVERALE